MENTLIIIFIVGAAMILIGQVVANNAPTIGNIISAIGGLGFLGVLGIAMLALSLPHLNKYEIFDSKEYNIEAMEEQYNIEVMQVENSDENIKSMNELGINDGAIIHIYGNIINSDFLNAYKDKWYKVEVIQKETEYSKFKRDSTYEVDIKE